MGPSTLPAQRGEVTNATNIANSQPRWTIAQFLVRGWEWRQHGHSRAAEEGVGSVFPGLGRKLNTHSRPPQSVRLWLALLPRQRPQHEAAGVW